MNHNEFRNLRFDRQRNPLQRRLLVVLGLLGGTTLLWFLLPRNLFFWLLIPVLGILGWSASFGWRQALVTLRNLIQRLEQL